MVFLSWLRQALTIPLEIHQTILPEGFDYHLAPKFPNTGNLLDGILIGLGLTGLRYYLTKSPLDTLAKYALKKDYYKKKVVREKFRDAVWKCGTYGALTVFGLSQFFKYPYLSNTRTCWEGYPYNEIPSAIYWYLMTEMGLYLQASVYIFFEKRRSDFWQMLIHHAVSLIIISGSYVTNFFPMGFSGLVIHDCGDIFLEGAKILNYMSGVRPWAKPCTDLCFIVFALVFFYTRLIIFPFVLIRSSIVEAYPILGLSISLNVFNVCAIMLLFLHIFWMSLILKMAVRMAKKGTVEKDERSDDEEEDEHDIEDAKLE